MKIRKIESHIHTNVSNDSILTNWCLLAMCKIKKIDCLIITNHNSMSKIFQTKKYFEKHNVLVISGEEIFTQDGEIIGLFLEKEIKQGLSAKETILQIRQQGGLVCIPHPYDEKRIKSVLKESKIKENINNIDCIEIHNGRNVKEEYSIKQKKISEKYDITPIIGSDVHSIFELGRNYIITKEKINLNKDNFIDVIKNSEFKCKPCIKWIHNYTKIVKMLKLLMKGDINGIYKIVKKRCRKKDKRII